MYNHTLKCVVPENTHTCLGKVVGHSEGGGGGGFKAKISEGRQVGGELSRSYYIFCM